MKHESAGGIIVNNGRIVLVESIEGPVTFPKGHIEPGETTLEAAYREIYEETGIPKHRLKLIGQLGTYTRGHKGGKEKKEITMFLYSTEETDLEPKSGDVTDKSAQWVTIDDVVGRLTYKEDKEFFIEHRQEYDSLR